MYDPIETDVSYEYLIKLIEKTKGVRFAVIGGWAVFLHVKKEYLRAFGRDYIKSRDIDVFIDAKDEKKFSEIIKSLEFKPSSYAFRYELIYDREEKCIISPEKAKKRNIFNLAYIFLDVFSNKKTHEIGSWVFNSLEKGNIEEIDGFPVFDVNTLLNLKAASFFEREKLDKEMKDACDIYALLFYSGKKISPSLIIKKAAEKIFLRDDLQHYIAEEVLGDSLKSSLVAARLREFLK